MELRDSSDYDDMNNAFDNLLYMLENYWFWQYGGDGKVFSLRSFIDAFIYYVYSFCVNASADAGWMIDV